MWVALKGESSDFFLHYLLPHIPFAADAIAKCKVCSTVQCRKSKWKTAERTKLLCLPHTHTHYWWVQKASVPYFSLCIGDNLDLDDCLGMSWACFPGIVRHILMLVGEILHLKKSQFFSLSHQLFNVFSLRDFVHINLHLNDHVWVYVCHCL